MRYLTLAQSGRIIRLSGFSSLSCVVQCNVCVAVRVCPRCDRVTASQVATYPVVAFVAMLLIIPVLIYATDHAPFQSLNLLRPDHFARLLFKVYSSWAGSANGKLKAKDM